MTAPHEAGDGVARRVFDGLVVLEVASGSVAASLMGMLLADQGARVVKVEPPCGDRLREWSPSGFLVWNRGKESVVLDLAGDAGRAEFRSLAARADVVVDALHPGAMRTWGLEHDDLRRANPGLVYCAIRGFDDDGPYAHLRAYEGVVAAKIGLMNHGLWGFRDGPIFLNAPVLGVSAAHLALGSVSAALHAREDLGVGQRVEVSMYTAATSYDYGLAPSFQFRQRHGIDVNIPKGGGASRGIVHGCSADDRWFAFMNLLPYQSRALVEALDRQDLLDDPRFANPPFFASADLAEEYEVELMETMRTLPGDEIVERMLATPDVGFEEVRTTQGAFGHPQVVHNRTAIVVDDLRHGPVRQVAPLGTFAATPAHVDASAPALGEHRLDADPLPVPARPVRATSAASEARGGPLAGVTIVELGHYFAMPYGLTLAASLGARVVKVEGLRGDPWRMLEGPEPEVFSAQCLQGKESVAVDLATPEGKEILVRLAARADAFVYSLRPPPAELGFAYGDLRPHNPDLIYFERPGYGTSGPYAGRPMYAHTADAVSGMYMRDGEYWLTPERVHGAPVFELKAIQVERMVTDRMYADGHGANAVFSTLLMALLAKKRFGVGQHVSSSMLHAALLGVADEFVDGADLGRFPRSDPEQFGLGARYRLYRAADGWVFLAAPTDRSWAACCAVLGRDDLRADPRAGAAAGSAEDESLAVELGRELAAGSAADWEQRLSAAGVGCAAVGEWPLQGFTSLDEGLRASGLTVAVEQPTLGPLVRPAAAARFSATPPRVRPGSVHGQDTEAVLRELGYAAAAIGDLLARGVVFSSR